MNENNAAQYLPLVQALAKGKRLQYHRSDVGWVDVYEVAFEAEPHRYRVKPKLATFYAVLRDDGSRVQIQTTKELATLDCDALNKNGNSRHKPYRVAKMVEVPDESC